MCGDDYPSIDFYHQEERRSRRDRKCRECFSVISKGQRYARCVTIMDGSASAESVCQICVRVASAHFAAERALGNSGNSYTYGELRETLRECMREEPHYVVAFRAAWKGLPVPKAPPTPLDMRRYSTVMG